MTSFLELPSPRLLTLAFATLFPEVLRGRAIRFETPQPILLFVVGIAF